MPCFSSKYQRATRAPIRNRAHFKNWTESLEQQLNRTGATGYYVRMKSSCFVLTSSTDATTTRRNPGAYRPKSYQHGFVTVLRCNAKSQVLCFGGQGQGGPRRIGSRCRQGISPEVPAVPHHRPQARHSGACGGVGRSDLCFCATAPGAEYIHAPLFWGVGLLACLCWDTDVQDDPFVCSGSCLPCLIAPCFLR